MIDEEAWEGLQLVRAKQGLKALYGERIPFGMSRLLSLHCGGTMGPEYLIQTLLHRPPHHETMHHSRPKKARVISLLYSSRLAKKQRMGEDQR